MRSVRVEALGEDGLVRVGGLPRSASDNGLIVTLAAGAKGWISSYRLERVGQHEIERSAVQIALEAKVLGLEQTLQDLESGLKGMDLKREALQRMRESLLDAISEGHGDFQDAAWRNFEEEQRILTERLHAEREIHQQRESIQRQLETARAKLVEQVQKEQSMDRALVVDIGGAPAGSSLQLKLRVPFSDAGWSPAYRIDARPQQGEIAMTYSANIRNGTGEDWQRIPVKLMTRRASGSLESPDPQVVYLDNPERNPPPMAPYERAGKLAFAQADAIEVRMEAAPPPVVERLTTQFAVNLGSPVSVPALQSRSVQIEQAAAEGEFWSAVTPALDTTAYLQAEAVSSLSIPLLRGPAVLTVDGAVVGQSWVDFADPGQDIAFGFGPNPAIEVEFKTIEQTGRNRGVFDKSRVSQREYRISLTNHMPMAHAIRVRESVPVARDDQIKVQLKQPQGVGTDPETGAFERKLTLQSGATEQLTTAFEVSAPREWSLPGGY